MPTTRSQTSAKHAHPSTPAAQKVHEATGAKHKTPDSKVENLAAGRSKATKSSGPSHGQQSDSNVSLLSSPPRSTAVEIGLEKPLKSDPETLLALLLAANFSSAIIGHEIAFRTARRVFDEGWKDVNKLKQSTFDRRVQVLTEGGYTRYREKSAKYLGDLADLVLGKYDGDLNNLAKAAGQDPKKTRDLLKEVKGVGQVAVDIFCRDAQVIWPYLAPFADRKALQAAEKRGLGKSAEDLFEAVGKDIQKLADLCTSLTLSDLEKP